MGKHKQLERAPHSLRFLEQVAHQSKHKLNHVNTYLCAFQYHIQLQFCEPIEASAEISVWPQVHMTVAPIENDVVREYLSVTSKL